MSKIQKGCLHPLPPPLKVKWTLGQPFPGMSFIEQVVFQDMMVVIKTIHVPLMEYGSL